MDATFTPPPVPGKPRPPHKLLGDAMRRPGGRRALSVLSIVLALAGVGMFAYPFATDMWSAQIQSRLRTEFTNPDYREAYRTNKLEVGQGFTRLIIDRKLGGPFDIDVLVVEGTTPAALKAGAGHYRETPKPGEAGNVAIAGHRTTYGRPFNRLNEMRPGHKVYLDSPFQRFEYTVVPAFDKHANPWAVEPDDYGVVAPPKDPGAKWLTLTTCHPKGSAKQRLILRLELTKTMELPKQTQ